MSIEVRVPFIEPWPTGVDCFITTIVAFTVGVVDVHAARLSA